MLHKIYSIYDNKAEAFLPPFFMPNDAMAIRAITDCLMDTNHQFHNHAHDYVLYGLGAFSDTDATFDIPLAAPIAKLIELLNPTEEPPFELEPTGETQ